MTDRETPSDEPAEAELEPEPGDRLPKRRRLIRGSYVWALLFTTAIGGWMLSGNLGLGDRPDGQSAQASLTGHPDGGPARAPVAGLAGQRSPELFRVRVKTFRASTRDAALVVRGRTEADARVEIQAETAGVVEAVPVAKGADVAKGTVLCKLETGARKATLDQAAAAVQRSNLNFTASEKLHKRGHTGRLKVVEYKADLDAAKAALEKAELDMRRTEIRAPFKGIVETQPAKVGDYLMVGETCAKLVALDPLIVVGHVSEREVGKIERFMVATAALVTGETVQGRLRYIAPAADPKTRTFRIEIQVANPDSRLRDGVTSDIRIPLRSETAHKFSPASLVLDDAGRIGVRVVEGDGTVRFKPVEILADEEDGVWVAGLAETVALITTGQDYVTDGQNVVAVSETETAKR